MAHYLNKLLSMKQFHFYYSETCKIDRLHHKWKPIRAIIDGKTVEATHYQKEKSDGTVYNSDERYLGRGVKTK